MADTAIPKPTITARVIHQRLKELGRDPDKQATRDWLKKQWGDAHIDRMPPKQQNRLARSLYVSYEQDAKERRVSLARLREVKKDIAAKLNLNTERKKEAGIAIPLLQQLLFGEDNKGSRQVASNIAAISKMPQSTQINLARNMAQHSQQMQMLAQYRRLQEHRGRQQLSDQLSEQLLDQQG